MWSEISRRICTNKIAIHRLRTIFMFRKKLKTLILFPVAMMLCSCGEEKPLVTKEPTMSEIAGHYELSEYSFNTEVDAEIRSNAALSYIEINPDGTLTYNKVPIVPERDHAPFSLQEFHTGTGTYHISPLGATSGNMFYGLYVRCGTLPNPLDTPSLRSDGESMILSFDYFDGDFFQRLVYIRKNQSAEQSQQQPTMPNDPIE